MLERLQTPQPCAVHVLSPCGALQDESALDRGVQALRDAGHCVHVPDGVRLRFQRFAGDDAQRMAALWQALAQPSPQAACSLGGAVVMASRGGYGASRLLSQVDWLAMAQAMRQTGHVLCGHSDVTAIQLALLAAGAPPHTLLHGPMVCFDFGQAKGVDATSYGHFDAATRLGQVMVDWHCPWWPKGPANRPCQVHGPVWGGNLSLLCSLVGTPFFSGVQGGILILEDVNEPVYKLERMLLQLLHAGVLLNQQAVVLGQFNPPGPVPHDHGYDFFAMVDYLRSLLTCPLLTNFPFGHCSPKACWYQGLQGTLSYQPEGSSGCGVEARLVQTLQGAEQV